MPTHSEHAKRAGVATPCTAHHVNYGGGCLNCGWNLTRHPIPSREERAAHLRALGFSIPDRQEA